MADLVFMEYSDECDRLIPAKDDSWDILDAMFTGRSPKIIIKGAWEDKLPSCEYTVTVGFDIWRLNGKIYRLQTKSDVLKFYSAVQALLLDKALKTEVLQ